MMSDTTAQSLTLVRGDDIEIQFSGAAADFSEDPSAWALQFSVAKNRGQTPVLTVTSPTITVTGTDPYVAHVPLTRAQSSLLTKEEYDWDLHRTDAGNVSTKAAGTLQVIAPVYPPLPPA
jgi:hypothetical protein